MTTVAAAVAAWSQWPTTSPLGVSRFEYSLPEGQQFRNLGRPVIAVSPDGRNFVYNAAGGLYLRSMGELHARVIAGTERGLTNPFFSPDGQAIAPMSKIAT